MKTAAKVFRFERNELDLDRYVLRRAGKRLPLSRMPMEFLILLLERRGSLVTREEIAARVWPVPESVDIVQGINTAVNRIRSVLNDDAAKPRFIETVVGKGYRFIAQVEEIDDGPATSLAATTAAPDALTLIPPQIQPLRDLATPGSPAGKPRNHPRMAAILVLGMAGLTLAAILTLRNRPEPLTSRSSIRSIAVLPLLNLSKDADQQYFADGVTDQLITSLVQSTSLRVISRTSVMQYENIRKPLPEIASALKVDAVVEGSIERRQGQVRIEAQLLDAKSDRHLWAQSYEGSESGIWALQDQITRDIAEQIAAKLRPANETDHSHNRPVSSAAYEDYLRGEYWWNKRSPESLKKAAGYFQMAIDAEPQYALAYVGLADTYNVMSFYGGPAPSESFPKAEAAARKALSLDNRLGEAHAALGDNLFSYHWDWAGAEHEFQSAIHLNSGYAPAHHWYSELLSVLGRHDEAIAEIERARQLDPLSLAINQTVAGAFYMARRYDEAALQMQRAIELEPGYASAHNMLGWIYTQKGMHNQAIAEFRRAVNLSNNSPGDVAALGWGYAEAGQRREARQIAAALETRSHQRYVSPDALARLYTAINEKNLAFERLEAAYRMRVDTLNNINVEPCYDSLRSDPRFQALVRRMNFPN